MNQLMNELIANEIGVNDRRSFGPVSMPEEAQLSLVFTANEP